jgi:molybdopterin molybdotransferase
VLTVAEAIASLLENARRLVDPERVELAAADGRVLAADIIAPIDVPPADNSAMDGYAIRHRDRRDAETPLPISQRITAGSVPVGLQPGTAARIFTGAEVPAGADTVVMQEQCREASGGVRILELPDAGANIRARGQDLHTGQKVLAAGQRLRVQDIGLAASLGFADLPLYRRLRVAVLSTGDELREPGQALGPGQIYNSNRFVMRAQLAAWGCEVVDLGVARDEPGAVRDLLLRAADAAEVIVTSGGVSVGEEDHVRHIVQELGSLDLWRIAIKPGKPFAFGQVRGKPFLGLPGNPVSVFVTLLVVARPYLKACQGITDHGIQPMRMTATFCRKGSSREDYLRVRSTGKGLELFPNLSSGVLYSTTWGDGLARQKVGEDIAAGDKVDYFPWALFG